MKNLVPRWFLAVTSASVLASCGSINEGLPSCGDAPITYKYPGEGSYGERFRRGLWWRVNLSDKPMTATSIATSPPKDAEPIVQCSTRELICAKTQRMVLAAPRHSITPGSRYRIAGADVVTEGCLRSVAGECTTALFISDCRPAEGVEVGGAPVGVVRSDCRSTGRGQRIMFIFDRARGVIAYEDADEWVLGTDVSDWDLGTLGVSAGMVSLMESKGLLSCEITSP